MNWNGRSCYAAHVAGALTGLLFGVFMLRNYVNETKAEKIIKIVFMSLFGIIIVAILVLTFMGKGKGL